MGLWLESFRQIVSVLFMKKLLFKKNHIFVPLVEPYFIGNRTGLLARHAEKSLFGPLLGVVFCIIIFKDVFRKDSLSTFRVRLAINIKIWNRNEGKNIGCTNIQWKGFEIFVQNFWVRNSRYGALKVILIKMYQFKAIL